MASRTNVGPVTRGDFLAIIGPGFFVFVVIHVYSVSPPADKSLWEVIVELSEKIQETLPLLIFILFATYLIGSILRAIPVTFTEGILPLFTSKFPYPEYLSRILDSLRSDSQFAMVDLRRMPQTARALGSFQAAQAISDRRQRKAAEKVAVLHWKNVFNYWKDVVCVRSRDGFDYYQSFETRSRLFAGVIWAAVIGIIGSAAIIVRTGVFLHVAAGQLFIISLTMLVAFGLNFRRIRHQEVCALVSLFCAYQQGSSEFPTSDVFGDDDSRPDPPVGTVEQYGPNRRAV